jgi:hypothetical protein
MKFTPVDPKVAVMTAEQCGVSQEALDAARAIFGFDSLSPLRWHCEQDSTFDQIATVVTWAQRIDLEWKFVKTPNFNSSYERWKEECLVEYNTRFNENRHYFEKPGQTIGYDAEDLVEFGEDGTAYPHGIGGTNTIKNAVTPWDKSKHYMPQ